MTRRARARAMARVDAHLREQVPTEPAFNKEGRLLAGLLAVVAEAAARTARRHRDCRCPEADTGHYDLAADAAGAAWAVGQLNAFAGYTLFAIRSPAGPLGPHLRELADLADAMDVAVATEGGAR